LKPGKAYLYQKLIAEIAEQIKGKHLKPGEKLPSIRKLCDSRGVSKSTVIRAYAHLESIGLIESRAKSGYIVRVNIQSVPESGDHKKLPVGKPGLIGNDQFLLSLMEEGAVFDLLPGKVRDNENTDLRLCLSRALRHQSSLQQAYYDAPQGLEALRLELSRYHMRNGIFIKEEDLTITSGCQNALLIALMVCTRPGDVVAVESPCFYGAIQLIQALGLRILEIPSVPGMGIDLSELEKALKKWDIKALMISPNFATPTGTLLSDDSKSELLRLCGEHAVKIIEDDIYGDLTFGPVRPSTLYSMDEAGQVILCSSFSKSVSRDLRIGWIASKNHQEKIRQLKIATSIAVGQSLQQGMADYMKSGLFERHIKKKRIALAAQCNELQTMLRDYLPAGKVWATPAGGLSLWYALPESVNTSELYSRALKKGLAITPGAIFSANGYFNNYLRISFAHEWNPERRSALKLLGEIIDI
jgi:DNA-binding transcriptional MocR family regulator